MASPIWAGIQLLAGDVAKIPRFVYRNLDPQGKEKAKSHPAYRVLRWKANDWQTADKWTATMVVQACVFGNAYSWIVRDRRQSVQQLLPLNAASTELMTDKAELYYRTYLKNGRMRDLPVADVWHIHGLTLDGYNGMSLYEMAKNSIGRGLAAELHANKFFSNGAKPSAVVTHPHRWDEESLQTFRENISKNWGGADNAYKIIALEEAMTWTQIGVDSEKAQLIAALEFSPEEAARWLGLPSHKLGVTKGSKSFNSVEQENQAYQDSTLQSWHDRFNQQSRDKLLTEPQKASESHTVEHLQQKVLLADTKTRYEVYQIGLMNRILNRNEVRALENMNPVEGGDDFDTNFNPGQALESPEESDPEPEENETDEEERSLAVHWELLEHQFGRVFGRLGRATEAASNNAQKWDALIGELGTKFEAAIVDELLGALAAAQSVGIRTDKNIGQHIIEQWCAAMNRVSETVTPSELPTAAARMIKELKDGIPQNIRALFAVENRAA